MSNNRKLLRDMKLAISTLLPAPPAWRGEFGVAMGEPICPPLTRGEIPQAPPLEVHPLKWVGRSPVCPVDCAGLKEFIVACQAKLEYSILELLLTFEKERTSTIGMIREGSHKTCELDVSTHFTSEHLALELGEQLRLTLHISDKEADTCKKCAAALGVNVNGAFGVYCYNNITKVHGHILGVLNLLLSGTKVWYLWPPGPRPNENSVAATTIVQHAGQLLWLPPGWYHMVDTTGVGVGIDKGRLPHNIRNINAGKKIRVAHGFTMWCLPAQLGEYAFCNYAVGDSEESQSHRIQLPKAEEIVVLKSLLVHHV